MSATVSYRNSSTRLDMAIPEVNMTTTFGVYSNDTDDEKKRILDAVVMAIDMSYLFIIAAFGVPGNLASIFTILSLPTVSSSKVSDSKLEVHVAVLAITDTMAILLKILNVELSARGIYYSLFGYTLHMFLMEFFSTYANWIVVAMTAERFLAVCFPLRVGRMYTRRKAIIVLVGLAVVTAALYTFHFFGAWEERIDDGFWWCVITEEFKGFIGVVYYVSGCYKILLPCALIFTGNALIIISIRQARVAQRHLTNSVDQGGRKAKDQKQITVMLVIVSVVFLVLNTPNAIFYFILKYWKKTLVKNTYRESEFEFTARFINFLSDANHAVNFYLYFLSMSSFRRRFLDSIRCKGNIRHRNNVSSVYRTSQTYLNSLHPTGGDSAGRPDGLSYSAFSKRSSSRVASGQPVKLPANGSRSGSSNNKTAKLLLKHDSQHLITANSDL